MIHVCFALYDKSGHFSKFTGTTMLSLFDNHTSQKNTPSITVHILHDNTLTQENRDKFVYLAARYNQLVKFYNVAKLCADKIAEINTLLPKAVKTRFTIAMFYRFFIPEVFPQEISKVIYLDSDIIVNLDINELWQIELGEKVLGVIPISSQKLNHAPKDGFNSGVLLINVRRFRDEEDTIKNAIIFFSKKDNCVLADQEILNYCFAKDALKLPVKFNRLVKWARYYKMLQVEEMIYHFNSHDSARGLGTDMSDPFNRLWMSYFIRTSWFDVDSIGRLCESYRKLRNDLRDAKLKSYNLMLGKSRAFFVEPENIDAFRKIFSIRDDELIIPAENEESIQKLLDEMKVSKGKCVFFIMMQKFKEKPFPFDLLTEKGFANNKDWVKGYLYLSEKNGGSFNTNPFIQVL